MQKLPLFVTSIFGWKLIFKFVPFINSSNNKVSVLEVDCPLPWPGSTYTCQIRWNFSILSPTFLNICNCTCILWLKLHSWHFGGVSLFLGGVKLVFWLSSLLMSKVVIFFRKIRSGGSKNYHNTYKRIMNCTKGIKFALTWGFPPCIDVFSVHN